MQARAQSVGRGGELFRGTWKKLNLGQKLRLGWGSHSAQGSGQCALSPRMEPTVSLPASSLPATLTPLNAEPNELELARSEIARQSQLLAAMTAETERVRAEATALSLTRCEALALISHDLRTPLNAVIGFSEAMQRELFGPLGHDRYKDYAVHIRESGEQLLKAAEAMIAQTRPGEPRF
jgi:signal transduction histidine kinase